MASTAGLLTQRALCLPERLWASAIACRRLRVRQFCLFAFCCPASLGILAVQGASVKQACRCETIIHSARLPTPPSPSGFKFRARPRTWPCSFHQHQSTTWVLTQANEIARLAPALPHRAAP
eukprot:361944-Chlamydomonas_euryale.AAC.11